MTRKQAEDSIVEVANLAIRYSRNARIGGTPDDHEAAAEAHDQAAHWMQFVVTLKDSPVVLFDERKSLWQSILSHKMCAEAHRQTADRMLDLHAIPRDLSFLQG